jgi:hypothetical protein
LKALKEQQEKQLEQEDDEMMYTYARENERKVKYNYTYSCAQNSLIASEIARHEKKSTAAAFIPQSYFSSSVPLSPVSLVEPLPFPPPLSPEIIKRSSRMTNSCSKISGKNIRRRRLQIVSSPPPPQSPKPFRKQKFFVNEDIKSQTPSRIIKTSCNSNHNNCVDSIIVFDSDDDDLHSNSNNSATSKSKTRRSTPHLARLPPILAAKNTNSGSQQKTSNNFRTSRPILKSNKSMTNLGARKSSNSRSSALTGIVYRTRSQRQNT